MPSKHHPRRGSMGYSPRKRATSPVPRIRTWPDAGADEEPRLQGFAGYKAGMTHVFLRDFRPTSTTSGQERQEGVTVLEVPPMRCVAVRAYDDGPYGLKTRGEAWAKDLPDRLSRRLPLPDGADGGASAGATTGTALSDLADADDLRLLVATQPGLLTGVPTKTPEVMEVRVGGGDLAGRFALAEDKLGQEVTIHDFTTAGHMVDVVAVTKGHGFQGSVPRWGVKIQSHKNSKNRRDATPLGPWHPSFIRWTVPMPGQTGYQQRTDVNKRVLKVGDDGAEVTPKGGFKRYGVVRNAYVILHGSVPGPVKRLVRLRDAERYLAGVEVEEPEITYISTESKQGA